MGRGSWELTAAVQEEISSRRRPEAGAWGMGQASLHKRLDVEDVTEGEIKGLWCFNLI